MAYTSAVADRRGVLMRPAVSLSPQNSWSKNALYSRRMMLVSPNK